jgi:hypothetical protein
LKIKTGGSLDILMKSYTTVNRNSPYEQEIENLSFGTFYNSTAGFIFDVSIFFWSYRSNNPRGFLFLGCNFEKSGISTNEVPEKYILGTDISQYKYTPYFGYGNYLDVLEHKNFVYGFLGVSLKNYEGKTTIPSGYFEGTNSMNVKYKYNDIIALRVGTGLDFERIIDNNFFISLNAYYDWGVANRGKGEGTYQGQIIEITPEGQNQIHDNTLYFTFTIGYNLEFNSSER